MNEKNFKKLLRFWILPFLSGGCIALGYVLTHKVSVIATNKTMSPFNFLQSKNQSLSKENLPSRPTKNQKIIQAELKTSITSATNSVKTKIIPRLFDQSQEQPIKNQELKTKDNLQFDSKTLKKKSALEEKTEIRSYPKIFSKEPFSLKLSESKKIDNLPIKQAKEAKEATLNKLFKTLPQP